MNISTSIVLYRNDPVKVNYILKSLDLLPCKCNIFIVDNSHASLKPDLDLSENCFYVHVRHNIGFGAGHNIVLRKLLNSKIKYHLVLNPDIVFDPQVIIRLFEYMEANPGVGNIMPMVTYPDGSNQFLAKLLPSPGDLAVRLFHKVLSPTRIKDVNSRYELHALPLEKPVPVPALSGCFMFLRLAALRKVGLFDERFFLYFEDFDLVRRISAEYKVIYYPEVRIKHHFERASRKNIFALASHLTSGIKYFNKWGWLQDEYREAANADIFARIIHEYRHKNRRPSLDMDVRTGKAGIRSVSLISNQAFSMLNFRGRLIRDLSDMGIKVFALAPDFDDRLREKAFQLGAEPVDFQLDRIGLNPAQDLANMLKLTGILNRIRPDAVLSNFIKPVIYGSWAARRAGVKNIFSMISGLGYVYTQSPSGHRLKSPVFREFVSLMYKKALDLNQKVFFHNPDDQALFVSRGIVDMDRTVRIYGSGVDVEGFAGKDPCLDQPFMFLMVARLLAEKGVQEYIQAAEILKAGYPSVRFVLLGGMDINPAGLRKEDLQTWLDSGAVEWFGQVDDVRPWLQRSHAFVLPSWREGTPRSSLEAMASGRAVITTDVPGCRETVFFDQKHDQPHAGQNNGQAGMKPGLNGILVPVRDPRTLARAMEYLIKNPGTAVEMGRQSRLLAEQHYDVRRVNAVILREMGILTRF